MGADVVIDQRDDGAGDGLADWPVYTEASFTMWSASSPCPHASWKGCLHAPRPDHRHLSRRCRPADSFVIARRAARSAAILDGVVLEHLEAERERERVKPV